MEEMREKVSIAWQLQRINKMKLQKAGSIKIVHDLQ